MKMALDGAPNANQVRGYAAGRVEVRDQAYTSSVIIMAARVIADWAPRSVDDLRSVAYPAR